MPSIMKCSTDASSRVERMMEVSRSVRVEALPAGDEAATPPQEWRVGKQRIMQGDCIDLLARLPTGSIDVVVTSPPYNIGVAYNSYDDRIGRASCRERVCQ